MSKHVLHDSQEAKKKKKKSKPDKAKHPAGPGRPKGLTMKNSTLRARQGLLDINANRSEVEKRVKLFFKADELEAEVLEEITNLIFRYKFSLVTSGTLIKELAEAKIEQKVLKKYQDSMLRGWKIKVTPSVLVRLISLNTDNIKFLLRELHSLNSKVEQKLENTPPVRKSKSKVDDDLDF